MADYSTYDGPSLEWQDFVKSTTLNATGLAPGQSITDLQHKTNSSRDAESAKYLAESGIQDKVSFKDHQIQTQDGQHIVARVYRPKNVQTDVRLPVYLFFHGGGFLFGTLSSEDANCQRLVVALPIIVVNVCYRHTPQFKHPTQANDAWDAFSWVLDHFDTIGGDRDKLIIGGISAGGSLAASVVVKENRTSKSESRIKGQILCIPQLFHPNGFPFHLVASRENCSWSRHVNAPIIPRAQLDLFRDLLGADDIGDTSLYIGNCTDADVVGMPKTTIIVAGMDPLRDEGLLYAEKLRRNK
ncbi:hypothetical protein B7463_g7836, partial [Scytalidium lignicola]